MHPGYFILPRIFTEKLRGNVVEVPAGCRCREVPIPPCQVCIILRADVRERWTTKLLSALTRAEYHMLQSMWRQKPVSIKGLRGSVAKRGVTLVATLNGHAAARELCGFTTEEEMKKEENKWLLHVKTKEAEQRKKKRTAAGAENARPARDEDIGDRARENAEVVMCKFGEVSLSVDEVVERDFALDGYSMVLMAHGIVLAQVCFTFPEYFSSMIISYYYYVYMYMYMYI